MPRCSYMAHSPACFKYCSIPHSTAHPSVHFCVSSLYLCDLQSPIMDFLKKKMKELLDDDDKKDKPSDKPAGMLRL